MSRRSVGGYRGSRGLVAGGKPSVDRLDGDIRLAEGHRGQWTREQADAAKKARITLPRLRFLEDKS